MTNKALKTLYLFLRRKYFQVDELPSDIKIRFVDDEELDYDDGSFEMSEGIKINDRFKNMRSYTAIVLLHEMVHVAMPSTTDHGFRFQERRYRLFMDGAYDDLL